MVGSIRFEVFVNRGGTTGHFGKYATNQSHSRGTTADDLVLGPDQAGKMLFFSGEKMEMHGHTVRFQQNWAAGAFNLKCYSVIGRSAEGELKHLKCCQATDPLRPGQ